MRTREELIDELIKLGAELKFKDMELLAEAVEMLKLDGAARIKSARNKRSRRRRSR